MFGGLFLNSEISNKNKAGVSFVSGFFILSFSTVLVKILGLVYKIPMLSYLGTEGMGYFNSAYEIYALLCVVATAGLPTALSILISSYRESVEIGNIKKVYKCAYRIFLIIGILGTLSMLAFAGPISRVIKNQGAYLSIMAVAPAFLCICISSLIRGYYQGYSCMFPTAVSQLIEALGKLVFGIIFASFALKRGFDIQVISAFAVLGLSVGMLTSTVFLVILKLNDRKLKVDFVSQKDFKDNTSLKQLLKIALPVTLSSTVIGSTRIVDMVLIMRRLQDIGYTEGVANEFYGAYTTVALPIFSLIPSLLAPISMALIPSLSAAIQNSSIIHQSEIVKNAIRITVIIALPSAFAMILYSRPIISLLFHNVVFEIEYVSVLLSLLGSSVLFSCMITTTNAILQTYRYTNKPIISITVGVIIKIIVAYLLMGISEVNIYGAPISTFFCDLAIVVINLYFINKVTSFKLSVKTVYMMPLLSSIFSLVLSYSIYSVIFIKTSNMVLSFLIVVPITVVLYISMSLIFKSITLEDVKMLPMGDKIYFVFNKLRIK